MTKTSAGILMYRYKKQNLQVFLVHPGGPFWKNKEKGAWSIPKGEIEEGEDKLKAAIREFEEEIGETISGNFLELGFIIQRAGKQVYAWAVKGDWEDGKKPQSNTIAIEWPPKSGRTIEIHEVDKAHFFDIIEAKEMINPAQVELIDRLVEKLSQTR